MSAGVPAEIPQGGTAGWPRKQPHLEEGPARPIAKGAGAVIFGEPETARFLAAVQRLKRLQRKRERQTRLAKQRVRAALRKMRGC